MLVRFSSPERGGSHASTEYRDELSDEERVQPLLLVWQGQAPHRRAIRLAHGGRAGPVRRRSRFRAAALSFDRRPVQLRSDVCKPLPYQPGQPRREDYEC
jgi:hypothetical protein